MPREYLTSVSDYFAKAVKGFFRGAAEKRVSLADVEPQIFGIFLECLYGRILVDETGEKYDGNKDADTETLRHGVLLDLCIFGDEYDVPQFRRDVLDEFIKYQGAHDTLCCTDTIQRAFKHLPSNSPMLRLLIDVAIYSWSGCGEGDWICDGLPPAFLYGIASKLLSRQKDDTILIDKGPYEKLCDYHEHDGKSAEEMDTEECVQSWKRGLRSGMRKDLGERMVPRLRNRRSGLEMDT